MNKGGGSVLGQYGSLAMPLSRQALHFRVH